MAGTSSYITRETLSEMLLGSPTMPESLAIIDVRDDDHVGGHIKGSVNVPSSSLDHRIPDLVRTLRDKEKVVFHCALSQQRGPTAAKRYLAERRKVLSKAQGGLTEGEQAELESGGKEKEQQVFVLEGGFVKWQKKYGKDAKLTDAYAPEVWAYDH